MALFQHNRPVAAVRAPLASVCFAAKAEVAIPSVWTRLGRCIRSHGADRLGSILGDQAVII